MNMVMCLDGVANGRYVSSEGIAVGETIIVNGVRYRLDDCMWPGEHVFVCDVLVQHNIPTK